MRGRTGISLLISSKGRIENSIVSLIAIVKSAVVEMIPRWACIQCQFENDPGRRARYRYPVRIRPCALAEDFGKNRHGDQRDSRHRGGNFDLVCWASEVGWKKI